MTDTKESQELATVAPASLGLPDIAALQKVAKVYAASSFLPSAWRKLPESERLANLIIIINRAAALKCDPLLLLQNLNIIAGQMCWKSTFLLQLLMANGWVGAKYEMTGDPTSPDFWEHNFNGCTFSAINPATGEREMGTKITVAMIKGEGWLDREGSKWRTMPEQMLKYRAVAFFARSNAPAVMGGFMAQDEIEDMVAQERAPAPMVSPAQVVEAEQPKELSGDIIEYIHKRYDDGVTRINSDSSLVTLAAKGQATDALIAELDRLRAEALKDQEGFRAKYMHPSGWASSLLNPSSSCYHD